MTPKPRSRRRADNHRIAHRQFLIHWHDSNHHVGEPLAWYFQATDTHRHCALGYWRKRRVLACACSKRSRGRPHLTRGLCYVIWGRGGGLSERRRGRRLERSWLGWAGDPLDFES